MAALSEAEDATRWRRTPGEALLRRQWGEAHFIFHPESGQTHFLNELGAWILDALAAETQNAQQLRTRMLKEFDAEATDELDAALSATLSVLSGLGLIDAARAAA